MSQGRPRAHAAGAAHPDSLKRGGGISNKSVRSIMRQRHAALEGDESDEEEAEKNLAAKIKARQASLREQQSSMRSAMSGDGMDEESDDSLFSSSSNEDDDAGASAPDDGYRMDRQPSIRHMSRNSFFNRAQVLSCSAAQLLSCSAAPRNPKSYT